MSRVTKGILWLLVLVGAPLALFIAYMTMNNPKAQAFFAGIFAKASGLMAPPTAGV